MKNREELTGLTLITALLVLLSIPTILGTNWQIGIGIATFVVSLFLFVKFLRSDDKKFSLIVLPIVFAFNPIFIGLQLFTTVVVNLILGFLLFGLALYMSKPN